MPNSKLFSNATPSATYFMEQRGWGKASSSWLVQVFHMVVTFCIYRAQRQNNCHSNSSNTAWIESTCRIGESGGGDCYYYSTIQASLPSFAWTLYLLLSCTHPPFILQPPRHHSATHSQPFTHPLPFSFLPFAPSTTAPVSSVTCLMPHPFTPAQLSQKQQATPISL